ncbi:MAG: Clp1/GlmU family protein [Candidatus Bathyarchaeota archaeon]|nr:Clp1/GlmU family protein [Candidatus Bathyarchaeota archaeon]
MQQIVESNKTLLVDGPASVRLTSGKAEVFGYHIKVAHRIVVRQGKRLPFYVLEKAVFDVSLGANASLQETDGSTIPTSWSKPLEAILAVQKRPVVVMVVGESDSGKSSLCTYLVNNLVAEGQRVAVLDGDLGQSDIGPSATVGYASTSKPITELFGLRLENAYFVGVTSPIMAFAKAVEALGAMEAEVLQREPDFVLVNTDGWVVGDVALRYKEALVNALKPDLVVGVQVQDELAPLINALGNDIRMVVVEPSSALSKRTAEKRKALREMTYTRYLKNAKLQCYPLSQLTVEPKNGVPKSQEPKKGLLVGLYGRGSKFLGIGVLRVVNQARRVLKVQTAVSAKPSKIVIGKVVLNHKLQEIAEAKP